MRILLADGTALFAASAVILYVSLLRLFAIHTSAADVFLIVGPTVGGAAGGAFWAQRAAWRPGGSAFIVVLGGAIAALGAIVSVAALVGALTLRLTLFDAALAFLAFVGIGAGLAAHYVALPGRAGVLAALQLALAALAAGGSALLLDAFGPVNTALLAGAGCAAGALMAVPAALAAGRAGRARDERSDPDDEPGAARIVGLGAWLLAGVGILAGLLVLPLNLVTGRLAIDPGELRSDRSLFASVQDADLRETVVFTTWDSNGRVDVTEPASTDLVKWLYLDGSPAGVLQRTPSAGGGAGAGVDQVRAGVGYLPFLLPGSRERVLVVGIGAGEEVQAAVVAGAKQVVATEANAGVLGATMHFASYAGNAMTQPGVQVLNEDGRTYLRRTGAQFDVIYLSFAADEQVVPSGAVEGSYLFTLEAFREYLARLSPEGRLVIELRDEHELTRAFNTSFQALTRGGATPLAAIRRMLAVNNAPLAERSGVDVALPVLIVRKTPFLEDEAKQAFDALSQTPYQPLFVPFMEGQSPLSAFAAEGLGPEAVEAQAPYRVDPATDGSPFFFRAGKGIPLGVVAALSISVALSGAIAFAARRPGLDAVSIDGDVSEGVAGFLEDDLPWRFVAFVAIASAGFSLVVYPLLYRLPAMIGQPSLGLPVVLAVLLAGGAAGSLLALAGPADRLRPAMGWAALAGALLAVASLELVPMLGEAQRGQSAGWRAAAVGLLVAPFGLCAGVPYPATLRTLAAAGRGAWATLLWGVSAIAWVAGTLLSLALGMTFGFGASAILGAGCLFVAFLMVGLRWLMPARGAPVDSDPPAPAADLTPFQRPA